MKDYSYLSKAFQGHDLIHRLEIQQRKIRTRMLKREYQLARLEYADSNIDNEIKELNTQLAALNNNIEILPDGELRDMHQRRIEAINLRLGSLNERTSGPPAETHQIFRKEITDLAGIIESMDKDIAAIKRRIDEINKTD